MANGLSGRFQSATSERSELLRLLSNGHSVDALFFILLLFHAYSLLLRPEANGIKRFTAVIYEWAKQAMVFVWQAFPA
jgi:hypothetical protein